MPVANHAPATVGKNQLGVRRQERLELSLDRLGDQPARPRSQNIGERIIDRPFLSKGNDSILVHGVTLLPGGSGGFSTNPVTPPSSHRHPVSRVAQEVQGEADDLQTLNLSCISDDAQGERLEVLWDAEIGAVVLDEDGWRNVGAGLPDRAEVLAAHLRAIRWRSATAADRDLLQAPFRAGIRLDAYQLLPLRKALRLPRVNLLIADDVGLGKTVEAGLVARELLLRRRIDFIVIAAPPAMTIQWKDELEAKFGLSFEIIDRERIGEMRRLRGFSVNPWATGSRFIVSHRLLTDEVYAAGLRDVLGEFRARALFILDEAHHAAPAAGIRYAISSQLTKAVRELGERFEHRLFLTATPHNGHSNSFSALLEMLDPQRFTRGVEVRPKDLEPVMVRRLKADLRRLGEAFPERIIEAVRIDGLAGGHA